MCGSALSHPVVFGVCRTAVPCQNWVFHVCSLWLQNPNDFSFFFLAEILGPVPWKQMMLWKQKTDIPEHHIKLNKKLLTELLLILVEFSPKLRFKSLSSFLSSKAKDERSRKGINSNDCTSNIEAASFPEPETFNTSNAKGVKDTPLGFSHQKNDIATDVQRNIKDEASHLTEARQTIFKNLLSWRYFMVLLLQTSFVVTVFLRQCMPMALVCMVRPPKTAVSSNHSDLPRTVFNNRTYANVHKDTSDQVSILVPGTIWTGHL